MIKLLKESDSEIIEGQLEWIVNKALKDANRLPKKKSNGDD
jgi:hypothetical protein